MTIPSLRPLNGRPLSLTPEHHERLISEGVEILEGVNVALPDGHKKFTVLGNLTTEDTRCYWFKMKCLYCRDMMVLCPPRKTLEVNIRNQLTGPKHMKVVEVAEQLLKEPARTGRAGRPSRSNTTSSHSNQNDLHTWFRTASSNSVEGTSQVVNRIILVGLMCYGYRGSTFEYGGNFYVVNVLLNDPHSSVEWYSEPHLRVDVEVRGVVVHVSCTFWHRKCVRMVRGLEPFPNLTCPMCAQIPRENDFRMRIIRED